MVPADHLCSVTPQERLHMDSDELKLFCPEHQGLALGTEKPEVPEQPAGQAGQETHWRELRQLVCRRSDV